MYAAAFVYGALYAAALIVLGPLFGSLAALVWLAIGDASAIGLHIRVNVTIALFALSGFVLAFATVWFKGHVTCRTPECQTVSVGTYAAWMIVALIPAFVTLLVCLVIHRRRRIGDR
jgi:hypothetical protein